jgi:hypothetical protein
MGLTTANVVRLKHERGTKSRGLVVGTRPPLAPTRSPHPAAVLGGGKLPKCDNAVPFPFLRRTPTRYGAITQKSSPTLTVTGTVPRSHPERGCSSSNPVVAAQPSESPAPSKPFPFLRRAATPSYLLVSSSRNPRPAITEGPPVARSLAPYFDMEVEIHKHWPANSFDERSRSPRSPVWGAGYDGPVRGTRINRVARYDSRLTEHQGFPDPTPSVERSSSASERRISPVASLRSASVRAGTSDRPTPIKQVEKERSKVKAAKRPAVAKTKEERRLSRNESQTAWRVKTGRKAPGVRAPAKEKKPTKTKAAAAVKKTKGKARGGAPFKKIVSGYGAISVKQHKRHAHVLKLIGMVASPKDLVDQFEALREARPWTFSTTTSYVGALYGACVNDYMSEENMKLATHLKPFLATSRFRMYKKELLRLETSTMPNFPVPATAAEVVKSLEAVDFPVADRAAMVIIWAVCGRVSDVLKLQTSKVEIADSGTLRALFLEGKGISATNTPFTVATTLGKHAHMVSEFIESRRTANEKFLWNDDDRVRAAKNIKRMLVQVNSKLELKSLRRGALHTMSAQGVPETTIIEFSRHTRIPMLRRYLTWNWENAPVMGAMAKASASLWATTPEAYIF